MSDLATNAIERGYPGDVLTLAHEVVKLRADLAAMTTARNELADVALLDERDAHLDSSDLPSTRAHASKIAACETESRNHRETARALVDVIDDRDRVITERDELRREVEAMREVLAELTTECNRQLELSQAAWYFKEQTRHLRADDEHARLSRACEKWALENERLLKLRRSTP